MNHVKQMRLAVIFLIAASFVLLAGCAGESEADASGQAQASVDPRFATADGLLAHYNSIATRTPVDARATCALFYAENEKQRQFLNIMQSMVPAAELDQLMRDEFGEGLDPRRKTAMLQGDGPAAISKRSNQRAEAKYTDKDGKVQTLYLVQIGDRWWISGYTVEYVPEWKEMIADMDKFEKAMAAMGDAANATIVKIKSGSVKTAQQARKAFGESMMATMPTPPTRTTR